MWIAYLVVVHVFAVIGALAVITVWRSLTDPGAIAAGHRLIDPPRQS